MAISGTTRLYVILGDPLHKARSPEILNAIFAERGVDAVMVPGVVDAAGLAEAVAGLKRLKNCDGFAITMPHKQTMCALMDELRENGRLVGAINLARRMPDGRWVGDIFDGLGYVAALRANGVDPRGKRVHLIGAGGVARAMAMALGQAGVASISVRDIDPSRAESLAGALGAAFAALRAEAVATDQFDRDIIANATPLGMQAGDALPCNPAEIPARAVVSDVIPRPEITPFLAAARVRGCRVVTGREMVEAQGQLVAAFLGLPDPVRPSA
jgi:shikimate dehydrogenase